MTKCFSVWSVLALVAVASACTKSSPSRPSEASAPAEQTASVTDAKTGISLTTPTPVAPLAGANVRFAEQPLTLQVRNAVSTGGSGLTYSFQIATDGNFSGVVFSRDGVAEGASGTTSVTADRLAGARTYFWRARANAGGVAGLYTTARAVNIGPEVVIQKPSLGDPAPNGQVAEQPTLNVYTVSRTGPAGPIKYRFEVSESSSFGSLVYTATADERTDLPYTPHVVSTKLVVDRTYYWRVQAQDPTNSVNGPFSDVQPFKVSQAIDINTVNFVCGSPNVSKWAATSQVTFVGFGAGRFYFDHTRNGSWPRFRFPDGAEQEATVWALFNIDGQWWAGGGERIRPSQTDKELGRPSDIGYGWYFMPNCGPMTGYVPRDGELVGFMATNGNARISDEHVTEERSNIVLIAWPGEGGGFFPPFAYEEPSANFEGPRVLFGAMASPLKKR
jgi:hypothetical protein